MLNVYLVLFFSILPNGDPSEYFVSQHGIRQGDPMSHALFSILFDLLSHMLAKAEDMGTINGVKVSQSSPIITHLMYVNDLVIYCQAKEEEAETIKNILPQYGEWTRKPVNYDKSVIHFSQNVLKTQRSTICSKLGMRECDHRS